MSQQSANILDSIFGRLDIIITGVQQLLQSPPPAIPLPSQASIANQPSHLPSIAPSQPAPQPTSTPPLFTTQPLITTPPPATPVWRHRWLPPTQILPTTNHQNHDVPAADPHDDTEHQGDHDPAAEGETLDPIIEDHQPHDPPNPLRANRLD